MSSILKALRKVEEEKRATTHAAPDLRSDQGTSGPRPKPFIALLTGAFLGVVCLGLLFFLILEKSGPEQVVTTQAVEEPVAQAPVSVPAAAAPVEIIPVVKMPPEPVGFSPNAPEKVQKTSRPASANTKAASSTKKLKTSTEKPAVQLARAVTEESVPLPAGVVLDVTEIFYQEEAENSMAVVNDLPVMVGTLIDSAIVTGIQPNRVLFDIDGNNYIVHQAVQ